MYADYDVDRIEVLTLQRSTRRARTPKTCDTCYKAIEVGSVYYYEVAIVDGEFTAATMHTPYGNCAGEV